MTELKQSLLPVKQFCTELSIRYQTLYYWVKKLIVKRPSNKFRKWALTW
ncbi:IS66 family insertion sequence element accessory protein TnpA [Shewanella frigidimarina]